MWFKKSSKKNKTNNINNNDNKEFPIGSCVRFIIENGIVSLRIKEAIDGCNGCYFFNEGCKRTKYQAEFTGTCYRGNKSIIFELAYSRKFYPTINIGTYLHINYNKEDVIVKVEDPKNLTPIDYNENNNYSSSFLEDECKGCYFRNACPAEDDSIHEKIGECVKDYRSDNKHVIFKLI